MKNKPPCEKGIPGWVIRWLGIKGYPQRVVITFSNMAYPTAEVSEVVVGKAENYTRKASHKP